MSDSSENVQATNIFKWQSTQHGKLCLSRQHLRHRSPRPAWSRLSWSRDGVYLQTVRRSVPSVSCSGFRHRGMVMPFCVNTVKGIQPCWTGCRQEIQLFHSAGQAAFLTPACASGGAVPSDPTEKSCDHSPRTWMASLPCVCGNALSVHPNERTSRCSPPRCTCRVSPLEETKGHALWCSITFQELPSQNSALGSGCFQWIFHLVILCQEAKPSQQHVWGERNGGFNLIFPAVTSGNLVNTCILNGILQVYYSAVKVPKGTDLMAPGYNDL